jgi:hypothetical protein
MFHIVDYGSSDKIAPTFPATENRVPSLDAEDASAMMQGQKRSAVLKRHRFQKTESASVAAASHTAAFLVKALSQ